MILPLRPTLANLVGSVLTHSLNRVYLVRAYALTQIAFGDFRYTRSVSRNSHTVETKVK